MGIYTQKTVDLIQEDAFVNGVISVARNIFRKEPSSLESAFEVLTEDQKEIAKDLLCYNKPKWGIIFSNLSLKYLNNK